MLNVGSEEQLTLFDLVEQPKIEEVKGNTFYVRYENAYFVIYYDRECKHYHSRVAYCPTTEGIFSKPSAFFSFNDGTCGTYNIVWVE
jgi:hypothetical protein